MALMRAPIRGGLLWGSDTMVPVKVQVGGGRAVGEAPWRL